MPCLLRTRSLVPALRRPRGSARPRRPHADAWRRPAPHTRGRPLPHLYVTRWDEAHAWPDDRDEIGHHLRWCSLQYDQISDFGQRLGQDLGASWVQVRCNYGYHQVVRSGEESPRRGSPGGGQSMALALPEPSTDKLERSPLSLVVCQVRYEENVAARDAKRALRIHEAIEAQFPVLEEQAGQQLTITAGPLGVQTLPAVQQRGWKMRSRLEALTRAVAAAIEPTLEQRVGLRFIDRITHPDVRSPEDWTGWIDNAFLGPIAHERLGSGITSSQQIVQIDAGEGRAMIVRHGAIKDPEAGGEWVYQFDQDCYVQRGRLFSADEVLAEAESLHTLALQVFQEAITPDLYKYLKGNE